MKFRVFKYRIPFNKPFITSVGSFENREGLILLLETNDHTAIGEIAPLPGFSSETLGEIIPTLPDTFNEIEDYFDKKLEDEEFGSILSEMGLAPSVQFGLDTLRHDLLGKISNRKVTDLLSSNHQEHLTLNTVIGSTEPDESIEIVKDAWKLGFRTFKLKVGINLEAEIANIHQMRKHFPKANIRLDANAAWSVEEAIDALDQFSSYHIEYCEQPVAHIDDLAVVKSKTDIPIAADESVRSLREIEHIIKKKAADVLIIKPMMMGHFGLFSVTKQWADTHGLKVVFTSSLESGVGRMSTAILAQNFGSKSIAHGLATDTLFISDVVSSPSVLDASLVFSDTAGIGIETDALNFNLMEELY